MHVRDQQLAVQLHPDHAVVTISFTVVAQGHDLGLPGGFIEKVGLTPTPITGTYFGPAMDSKVSLPLEKAVAPTPQATHKELFRSHTFQVPRYPQGGFTTVKFRGYIEITPNLQMHVNVLTGEGVLPPKYTASDILSGVVGRFLDFFRRS